MTVTAPPRPRPRRRGRKLLLALGSLVAALGLLELGVRLVLDPEPPFLQRSLVVEANFRPGFDGLSWDAETGRDVRVRANRYGYRGPEWAPGPAPERLRIAMLGDSMLAGIAQEEHLLATRLLEGRLGAARDGRQVEVMNFGVSGAAPNRHLLTYRGVVRDLQPDLVLVGIFVGNDLYDVSPRLNRDHRCYFDLDAEGRLVEPDFPDLRYRVSTWLNHSSQFYRWQKGHLRKERRVLHASVGSLSSKDWIYAVQPEGDEAHAWRLLEALIVQLSVEVRADGARFALFVIPEAPQVSDAQWAQMAALFQAIGVEAARDQPFARLAQLGEAEGFEVFDVFPAMRAAGAVEELYIGGAGHFTDRGHAVLAQSLHGFMGEKAPDWFAPTAPESSDR